MPRDPDTTLGGFDKAFPETTMGIVARIRGIEGDEHVDGLTVLCDRYWKPVYRFIRAAFSKKNEDAKDLTQAFFLWLMEKEVLRKYEPELGTLRTFLKVLLRRFVAHHEEALRRLKRGGGVKTIPLAIDDANLADVLADPKSIDPEAAFDQAWRGQLVERAMERVAERCAEGKKKVQWDAFQAYDMAPAGEKPTYAEVAALLSIKESDVRNYLFAIRQRVRTEIRAELVDTVSDYRDLKDEWNALFGDD